MIIKDPWPSLLMQLILQSHELHVKRQRSFCAKNPLLLAAPLCQKKG